jgi:RNA polymerase sigma factor (sigma-70 family)
MPRTSFRRSLRRSMSGSIRSAATRRSSPGSPSSPDEAELAADPDEDAIARIDEALDVHDAMAGLPENCREILDRFFARDETYRTIGEALELPAGTIASRISRCLVKLRDELEGRKPVPAQSGGQVSV